MKDIEQVAGAIRELCRGTGIMDASHERLGYPELFGVNTTEEMAQFISNALDRLLDSRQKSALQEALGLGNAKHNTLTKRREAWRKRAGVTFRTVVRHEQQAAEWTARMIVQSERDVRHPAVSGTEAEVAVLRERLRRLEEWAEKMGYEN